MMCNDELIVIGQRARAPAPLTDRLLIEGGFLCRKEGCFDIICGIQSIVL